MQEDAKGGRDDSDSVENVVDGEPVAEHLLQLCEILPTHERPSGGARVIKSMGLEICSWG